MGSSFGEKSIQINESQYNNTISHGKAGPGGGGGSHITKYLIAGNRNSIKPSVSFLSMGRKDYKQVKYTDEFDGPSSMQVLGNENIKNYIAKNIFEKEREDHL